VDPHNYSGCNNCIGLPLVSESHLLKRNTKDRLPGRLENLYATQSQDAGPVNCILSFGLKGQTE
jgi:hypothetical protein